MEFIRCSIDLSSSYLLSKLFDSSLVHTWSSNRAAISHTVCTTNNSLFLSWLIDWLLDNAILSFLFDRVVYGRLYNGIFSSFLFDLLCVLVSYMICWTKTATLRHIQEVIWQIFYFTLDFIDGISQLITLLIAIFGLLLKNFDFTTTITIRFVP